MEPYLFHNAILKMSFDRGLSPSILLHLQNKKQNFLQDTIWTYLITNLR